MKAVNSWSFYPFVKLNEPEKALLPYVCRISPYPGGFTFDWFDKGSDAPHNAVLSLRGGEVVEERNNVGSTVRFDGLRDGVDYSFTLSRSDGSASVTRLVVCGDYLGDTVINYLHPEDGVYSFSGYALCSPSIVKLPNGRLVASMDVFKGRASQNLSIVFASDDNGLTWQWQCELYPCFWPKLFVHKGALYCCAVSTEYGDLLIGRSDDGGKSFTSPPRLLPGTFLYFGPHKNPVPFITSNGRIWSACEYGSWSMGYHDMGLFSAPEDSDLLDPESWSFTPWVRYDPDWPGAPEGSGLGRKCAGAGIEGNTVETPDGNVAVLYRMDIGAAVPNCRRSLLLYADKDDPEAPLSFGAIVENPLGSNSKFYIQRDPVTGKYYEIGTEQDDASQMRTRLSMAVSENLTDWKVIANIYDIRHLDKSKNGLQYPDWIIDGDDILLLTRTALNGAANFHDSNCATFKRIRNFRDIG